MALKRPTKIQIDDKSHRPWEQPDALWRKVPMLRNRRLEAVVRAEILPVVQQIDALIPGKRGKRIPRLAKKSYSALIKNPAAIEYALHLFDIAHAAGLITFVQAASGKGRARPITAAKAPIGPCGMTLKDARHYFMMKAAENIAEKRGHKLKKLHEVIGQFDLDDPSSLHKLEMLLGFDPLSITELQKGLSGRLGPLLRKDDGYLVVMQNAKPIHFLRPLRAALESDFRKILDWDTRFIVAVAQGLDHSAKIVATGKSLLDIKDPAVIHSLGRWPMREEEVTTPARGKKAGGKRKKYISRIEEVRLLLGVQFNDLLDAGPELLDEVGTWTDADIESVRNYLEYFGVPVIKALQGFPLPHKVGLLDGLWEKLGRDYMEMDLNVPPSCKAIAGIIAEISSQMGLDRTPPDKVKNLVLDGFFDHHLMDLLKMKEMRARKKEAEEKEAREKEAQAAL